MNFELENTQGNTRNRIVVMSHKDNTVSIAVMSARLTGKPSSTNLGAINISKNDAEALYKALGEFLIK